MSVLAHFEPINETAFDKRFAPRHLLSLGSVIEPCQSNVVIQNISRTGLLLESLAGLAPGDSFEVQLPEMAGSTTANVVWREGPLLGCQFKEAIPQAAISAALLRSIPLVHLGNEPPNDRTGIADRLGIAAPARSQSAMRTIKTVAVAALILAGLSYLLVTANVTAMIILGGFCVLLSAVLIACCSWALDNAPAV